MSRRLCLHTIVALVVVSIGMAKADTFTTFSIGNSLTVDSNIQAMSDMAATKGITVSANQAIHGGVGLDFLWNNPTMLDTGTPYTTGLSTALNAVTLEPFLGGLSLPATGTPPTDAGDVNRITDFMNFAATSNPANVNTQFYVFARWQEQSGWNPTFGGSGGYAAQWNTPYNATTNNNQTGDYYAQLLTAVHTAQPQNMKPVELIPTGFVFAAIDQALNNGQLPAIAAAGGMPSLYRDELHLSELGQFIASTTFYSTIFHEDPTGMAPPTEFPGLDSTTVNQLESIIWNVETTNSSLTGVPEPTSLALVSLIAVGALRRRR
jgi:hypothetical protein